MVMMVYELLPESYYKRCAYKWILGSTAITAWGMLFAFLFWGYNSISIILSTIFIITTYIFGWNFIRDILKAKLGKSVLLLAVSSIFCLIISSSGPFLITYIYLTNSFKAILYRDALFTYLHFQYNGFFSLAIFALLFNHIGQTITAGAKKNISRFTVVLCVSIIPSLFLSYLWQDPDPVFRLFAIVGSCMVLLSFLLFVLAARSLKSTYQDEEPVIRFLAFLSLGSFMLKLFLQCFTIFPEIGNAIFGNRPVIMGFLHLVFLGFVSLFILGFFAKKRLLDSTRKFTRVVLVVFALAVIFNEAVLITQGLAALFIPGNTIFPWLLWGAAIWLFAGTLLIAIARIRTRQLQ